MPLQLIAMIALIVLAATAAAWAITARRQSAAMLSRIGGTTTAPRTVLLAEPGSGRIGSIGKWLAGLLPEWLVERQAADQMLVQAGYDSPLASAWYGGLQLVIAAAALALVLPLVASASVLTMAAAGVASLAIGALAPRTYVRSRRSARRARICAGLPDSLDMLLVCVEAGISIDAAILRVGRELSNAHPELADELLIVNRRQHAGMTREDALRGLYDRTGVVEVRHLVSSMVQAERWGTSIARTLRVTSEGLRRQRRERAQRRAALISLKMVFPLALLILPPLLAVILGPAFIAISGAFGVVGR